MKNLYNITDKLGIHLCYQVANNEEDAVRIARIYGHARAAHAEFIRED